MGARAGRVVVATVACLIWLNGCETSTKLGDLFQKSDSTTQAQPPGTDVAAEATGQRRP